MRRNAPQQPQARGDKAAQHAARAEPASWPSATVEAARWPAAGLGGRQRGAAADHRKAGGAGSRVGRSHGSCGRRRGPAAALPPRRRGGRLGAHLCLQPLGLASLAPADVASVLTSFLASGGLIVDEGILLATALDLMVEKRVDFVDAYLAVKRAMPTSPSKRNSQMRPSRASTATSTGWTCNDSWWAPAERSEGGERTRALPALVTGLRPAGRLALPGARVRRPSAPSSGAAGRGRGRRRRLQRLRCPEPRASRRSSRASRRRLPWRRSRRPACRRSRSAGPGSRA